MIVREIVQSTVTDLRLEAYYSLAFEHQTYKGKNGNSKQTRIKIDFTIK